MTLYKSWMFWLYTIILGYMIYELIHVLPNVSFSTNPNEVMTFRGFSALIGFWVSVVFICCYFSVLVAIFVGDRLMGYPKRPRP